MDDAAIVTLIEEWRDVEYRVEHLDEYVLATHQTDEAFGVVEDRPCVVPGVALSEGVAPLQRTERRLERAVFIAATHELRFVVEHVLIVHGTLAEWFQLFIRLAQSLTELVDAPVIVGVFQRTSHILVDTHIVGYVAKFVVVFKAKATRGRYIGVNGVGSVNNSLPKCFGIVASQTFQVCIGND